MSEQRQPALDALRGLAVLGMVLSGSLGMGAQALPAWMYHVQVPPPLHRFDPRIPGIGWVDLVFPMFLFALGAALPLALRGLGLGAVARTALRRGALLLAFALFTQQFKATHLGNGATAQGLSLLAFGLLGLLLTRGVPGGLRAAAALVAVGLWAAVGVDPQRHDIILVVLAVMACSGALLWALTRERPHWRWWLLPAIGAVWLAPPEAWTQALQATPAPWAYRFLFLKYLMVVVPGMTVGEWLAQGERPTEDRVLPGLALALVVLNLTLLYLRETAWNAGLSAALLTWGGWRARRAGGFAARAWPLATALLLLGLLLEPLQGGIRKDPSTLGYLVVTPGLSLLVLLALQGLRGPLLRFLAAHGRNPLLAYVAGSLCVLPLLQLSGLHSLWAGLDASPAQALLRGLVFTGLVSGLTLLATRWRVVWRT